MEFIDAHGDWVAVLPAILMANDGDRDECAWIGRNDPIIIFPNAS
jgi:hypothetical protein